MKRKLIACDVDLTVVDTLTPWLKWFESIVGLPVNNEDHEYDLVPEMRQLIHKAGVPYFDPMKYWHNPNLYDNLEPLNGSVMVLEALSKTSDIVFVSSCVPEHMESKLNFLKRNFYFMKGFLSTHDKHFVDYDLLIDDKIEHILKGYEYRPYADHLLFTGVRADGQPEDHRSLDILSSWNTGLN